MTQRSDGRLRGATPSASRGSRPSGTSRALGATTVIAAHQKPGSINGPQCVDESIQYIEDVDRLHTDDIPIDKFIAEMLALHGDRLNITTLYHVTYMLSGQYPGYF